jgi:hypothetical protein
MYSSIRINCGALFVFYSEAVVYWIYDILAGYYHRYYFSYSKYKSSSGTGQILTGYIGITLVTVTTNQKWHRTKLMIIPGMLLVLDSFRFDQSLQFRLAAIPFLPLIYTAAHIWPINFFIGGLKPNCNSTVYHDRVNVVFLSSHS